MNDIVLAASDELRIVFDHRVDRWGHRIEIGRNGKWSAALSSIEGDSSDEWPPSPPFQHIHLQTFSLNGPTALLVGKAGTVQAYDRLKKGTLLLIVFQLVPPSVE